nr:hypothetical protein [Tanacetum cinerariifolium]
MTLLNKLMETCATLTQKVAHLEQDKVAQALEITKLKQRVRKFERKRRSQHFSLKRLRKIDADEDVTLVDVDTAVEMDADTQKRMEEDVTTVKELNAAEPEPTIFDDEEVTMTMAHTLITMKAKKSRILDEQVAKRQQDKEIKQAAAREKHDKEDLERAKVLQEQMIKSKKILIAMKNMIVYLKNMAGYKIQYFKGMTYDQVRPIFKREYNNIQTYLKSDRDEEFDEKKIVISEAVIREILKLNDAEGVVCLPNEEIFIGLAQMEYEKPSTKLTFYKAFFSSQWKFLIHTILQSLSTKRTSWNEFSIAMAFAVICISKGQRFNFSKYIFDSLVRNVDSSSKFYMYPQFIQLIIQTNIADLSTHTTRYISPALTQKVFANMRRVGKGFLGVEIPLFESMLVVRDVAEEQLEIVKLKAKVKKLEKINMVKSSKLRWLKKVRTSQRVESSDDMENVFNQERKIADMDQDEGIELVADHEKDAKVKRRHADKQAELYNLDQDHSSKVWSMQEDDTEVQEAVEIVTTAKLMTKVVTAAATQAVAASTPILAAKPKILNIDAAPVVLARRTKGVVIRDPEEELPSDTPP